MRALLLITAVGAALRLYGLDHQSLWNDELSALADYHLASWRTVLARIPADHTPGYWMLMHYWVRWFGDSEIMLRLPAALAGIATIPAMFALGRRVYGSREGLIAAALTATAWMPVYYSQDARPYAFLLLLVVLSSTWLLEVARALDEQRAPPLRAAIGYVIAAESACYMHYFGLFFTVLQAALMVLVFGRRPAALRRLAAIYGLILFGYLPWLRRAVIVLWHSPTWLLPPGADSVPRLLLAFFNNSGVIAALAVALWTMLLATALVRVRHGERPLNAWPGDALLFAWLIVPIALVYVRSLLVAPAFGERYLIIVAPAAYLLAARALTQLPLHRAAAAALAVALPVLLLMHLVFVLRYFSRPTKDQFREAAAYLVQHDTPGSDALVLACAWNPHHFNYYLERLGSRRRVDRLAVSADDRRPVAALIATRSPDSVWLLAGHREPAPELIAWLSDELQLVGQVDLVKAHAWHFVARHGPR